MKFTQAIFTLISLILSQHILPLAITFTKDNGEVIKTSSGTDFHKIYKYLSEYQGNNPNLLDYQINLNKINQLPADVISAQVDQNWILGANHVLKRDDILDALQNGYHDIKNMVRNDRYYYTANLFFTCPGLDLCLAHLSNASTAPSIKRYYGNNLVGDDYYIVSNEWHDVANVKETSATIERLYTRCQFPESGLDTKTLKRKKLVEMPLVNIPEMQVSTHGGDSSCSVFKKVGEEFMLFGNNVGPKDKLASVVVTSHPETDQWINNLMLSISLGTIPNFYIYDRPDLLKDFVEDENSIYYKSLRKADYYRTLNPMLSLATTTGAVLIDPWYVLLPITFSNEIGKELTLNNQKRKIKTAHEIKRAGAQNFILAELDQPINIKPILRNRELPKVGHSCIVYSTQNIPATYKGESLPLKNQRSFMELEYKAINEAQLFNEIGAKPNTKYSFQFKDGEEGLLYFPVLTPLQSGNKFCGFIYGKPEENYEMIDVSEQDFNAQIDKHILSDSLAP